MGDGTRQPWDRLEDETSKAFHAFCLFRDLDPGKRSYREVSEILGLDSQASIERWASPQKHNWQERVLAYDDYRNKRLELLTLPAPDAIEEALHNEGAMIGAAEKLARDKLADAIANPDKYDALDLTRIVNTLEKALNLRRRLLGLPTTYRAEYKKEEIPDDVIFVAEAEHLG